MPIYKIVYKSNDLLIINKPQGIPSDKGENKSIIEYLYEDIPEVSAINGYNNSKGGLLNRLDNETGGLLLVGLTQHGFDYYYSQMVEKKIIKRYIAISYVEKEPEKNIFSISIPIAHHPKSSKKMIIVKNESTRKRGKDQTAETIVSITKTINGVALCDVMITSGVRHQIRCHLSYCGLPIINDKIYSNYSISSIENHFLFCYGLEFTDIDKKYQVITTNEFFSGINQLPLNIEKTFEFISKQSNFY